MRIIITGGTGLIGQALVHQLMADEHETIVLSRNPTNKNNLLPAHCRIEKWDAKTAQGWGHLVNKDTVIVNLAGENPANWRWTEAHKQRVRQSRVNVSNAMVEAIENALEKPRALIQASAVGYYGDCVDQIIAEDTPPSSGFRADVCVEWERIPAHLDVRQVYLRIGIVLDTAGGALPPFRLASYLFGRRLGDGKQWIPWIHNDDVANIIRFLIPRDDIAGAVNVVAPNPATNRQMMSALSQITGMPSIIPVPALALKLALGEMAETILDSQRVIPQKLNEAGYIFKYPDIVPALHNILS